MVQPGAPEPIAIAMVGKPRGLRGEVRLSPLGRTLETLSTPHRVMVGRDERGVQPMVLRSASLTTRGFVGVFEGVDDCDAAERLRNLTIYLDRSELPSLGEREHYHFELEGLKVVADDGAGLGTVREVHNYPTTDALEVEGDDGSRWLLPMIAGTVIAVDAAAGVIKVRREALSELF